MSGVVQIKRQGSSRLGSYNRPAMDGTIRENIGLSSAKMQADLRCLHALFTIDNVNHFWTGMCVRGRPGSRHK